MINQFLRYKSRKFNSKKISQREISYSKRILFSVFTRYGDTIINLVVIKEFIDKFPNKDYVILIPPQMEPYVEVLLPNTNCYSVNKRNPIQMYKVQKMLRNWSPDLGFNPWSNGLDSCYFLTYAKKYFCYKDYFFKLPINHYDVVRKYLQLPLQQSKFRFIKPKDRYQRVLICPDSTDKKRSINDNELIDIVEKIKKKYNAFITIAVMNARALENYDFVSYFEFKKTRHSSEKFLRVMNDSDLVISADSAPIHIALALEKDICAIFKTTKIEFVVNNNSNLIRYDEF